MKPSTSLLTVLIFVAATHCLVDLVAGTLNPLWPRFETHFHLAGWETAALFFLWQITTSISQFFFGLYGDRFHSRWLLWAGPIAAVICLGAIGLTNSPLVLAALLVVGGLGIAAFHPEAAALAGSCAPEQRSRVMSIFIMGGFIGQAIGPVYSGGIVDHFGLRGLGWGIAGGLFVCLVLLLLGRRTLTPAASAVHAPRSLSSIFQGRKQPLLLVLVIGSLRIIAASGVPVLIGYLLAARHADATQTGIVQSAFMAGIGLGGLVCATLLKSYHERLILWLCPLLVTPVLVVIPWTSGPVLAAVVCLTGILLGVSLPVLISFGQQLMPGSPRIASSITMGVSWGVGGAVMAVILAVCRSLQSFDAAFYLFAVATAISSGLCIWLPEMHAARTVVLESDKPAMAA
jgi:FSR family fosmidomycin resistance protein-like MFS transporter